MSRHDRAILMGKDSDAFNRWEAGQILAAEIMLEVARPGAAATPIPIISPPWARCWRAPRTIPPSPPRC